LTIRKIPTFLVLQLNVLSFKTEGGPISRDNNTCCECPLSNSSASLYPKHCCFKPKHPDTCAHQLLGRYYEVLCVYFETLSSRKQAEMGSLTNLVND